MERKLPEWMLKPKKDSLAPLPPVSTEKSPLSPVLSFEGKIRFINTFCDCCYVCEALLQELETVNQLIIGFDMEWPIQWNKTTGVNQDKTALIQICPSAEVCYLFHVTEWKHLPKILIEFISHPKVRLVGLNIQCDIWKLGRDFDISVIQIITHNAIELSSLANNILSINQIWSLARLTLYVLKKKIIKSSDTKKSNWAVKRLTAEQLTYAATDAYVSLIVYQRLQKIKDEICADDAIMNKNV